MIEFQPSAEQVYEVCQRQREIQDSNSESYCKRCPALDHTNYGPGVPGCYLLAEGTIELVRSFAVSATEALNDDALNEAGWTLVRCAGPALPINRCKDVAEEVLKAYAASVQRQQLPRRTPEPSTVPAALGTKPHSAQDIGREPSTRPSFSPKLECEVEGGCQYQNNQCVEVGRCLKSSRTLDKYISTPTARSKSEYKRLKEQGADVLPPDYDASVDRRLPPPPAEAERSGGVQVNPDFRRTCDRHGRRDCIDPQCGTAP